MNYNLKFVFYCATNSQRWGKGYTAEQAKKNAGIVVKKPNCEYYVMAAAFNDPSEKELENLFTCITANQIDGSPHYYNDNRTEEDTEMINRLHIGWGTIEKNY